MPPHINPKTPPVVSKTVENTPASPFTIITQFLTAIPLSYKGQHMRACFNLPKFQKEHKIRNTENTNQYACRVIAGPCSFSSDTKFAPLRSKSYILIIEAANFSRSGVCALILVTCYSRTSMCGTGKTP